MTQRSDEIGATRWRLLSYADPRLHFWHEECVAHNALSNDTYRLTRPAGLLLIELAAAGVGGATEPGGSIGLLSQDAGAILESLEELDFVERC